VNLFGATAHSLQQSVKIGPWWSLLKESNSRNFQSKAATLIVIVGKIIQEAMHAGRQPDALML
jgi:hypothetical protein